MTFFTELRSAIGVAKAEEIQSIIAPFYCQKWRKCHNLDHIDQVMSNTHRLLEIYDFVPTKAASLMLAVVLHDVMFVYGGPGSEEASAIFAGGLDIPCIDEVMRLIRLTKDHTPEFDDQDGIVICDADLLDLGDKRTYWLQRERVLAEVTAFGELHGCPVTDRMFADGRRSWIREILGRKRIYHGPRGYEFEICCRANLADELYELDKGDLR